MIQHLYKSITILLFLSFSLNAFCVNEDFKISNLTETSKVSLLTIGRGHEEIYQYFGHSAIRIKDSVLGWDLVYNYGTFSYGDDFLKQFIKGRLLYYESIDNFLEFEQNYREENRSINEQNLNLTLQQKQTLFEKLTINAREENKYYKYDFLFDNCSTRPRDIILSLFTTKKYAIDKDDKSTYRELIDRNVENEWLDLGMDILIGIPTDQQSKFGRTFLPEELMQLCDSAIVDGKNLVKDNQLILDTIPESGSRNWFSPTIIFWILLLIIFIVQVTTSFFSKNKIIQFVFFTILGLLGWLFIFMWFGTDHRTTKWNLNILWAMPLHIPIIYFFIKKEIPKFAFGFIKTYRIILIILLTGWFFNPQTYHLAIIPIILIAILFASTLMKVPTTKDFEKRVLS